MPEEHQLQPSVPGDRGEAREIPQSPGEKRDASGARDLLLAPEPPRARGLGGSCLSHKLRGSQASASRGERLLKEAAHGARWPAARRSLSRVARAGGAQDVEVAAEQGSEVPGSQARCARY